MTSSVVSRAARKHTLVESRPPERSALRVARRVRACTAAPRASRTPSAASGSGTSGCGGCHQRTSRYWPAGSWAAQWPGGTACTACQGVRSASGSGAPGASSRVASASSSSAPVRGAQDSPASAAARASAARSCGRLASTVRPPRSVRCSRRTAERLPRARISPPVQANRKKLPGSSWRSPVRSSRSRRRRSSRVRASVVAEVVPSSTAQRGPTRAVTTSSRRQCPTIQGRPERWWTVRVARVRGRQAASRSVTGWSGNTMKSTGGYRSLASGVRAGAAAWRCRCGVVGWGGGWTSTGPVGRGRPTGPALGACRGGEAPGRGIARRVGDASGAVRSAGDPLWCSVHRIPSFRCPGCPASLRGWVWRPGRGERPPPDGRHLRVGDGVWWAGHSARRIKRLAVSAARAITPFG